MTLVNSIFDLARHVGLHRKRMNIVFEFACAPDSGPNGFWDYHLPLKIAILVHDLEKYLFLPWLWKYYGAKGKNYKRSDAIKLYTRMNKVGSFIRRIALFPWKEHYLITEEHIIDVVDRHLDPVALEEFNLKVQRPLSDFLSPSEIVRAQDFISVWQCHTTDLQYDKSKRS